MARSYGIFISVSATSSPCEAVPSTWGWGPKRDSRSGRRKFRSRRIEEICDGDPGTVRLLRTVALNRSSRRSIAAVYPACIGCPVLLDDAADVECRDWSNAGGAEQSRSNVEAANRETKAKAFCSLVQEYASRCIVSSERGGRYDDVCRIPISPIVYHRLHFQPLTPESGILFGSKAGLWQSFATSVG